MSDLFLLLSHCRMWYVYEQYKGKKRVKESHNRPSVAQRVPGGLGSQISWHSAHEGGEVLSLTHRPPLRPGNVPGTHFHYGLSQPQGCGMVGRDMSLKNPVTPLGIDPRTIRLVAQRLNHYATPGPMWTIYILKLFIICHALCFLVCLRVIP
jgi:hypothetical protein